MRDAVESALHHAVVAAALVALFLLWRKRRVAAAEAAMPAATAPLPAVPLADVVRATDGFHRSRLLGRGRHFAVYAAAPGVAAKRMHPHLVLGDAGGRRFLPARVLAAVPPHPDLAALVGVAEGPGERVLLVERAPAGAVGLDRMLFGHGQEEDAAMPMPWRRRAASAAAAGRALAHLHAHGVGHGRVRACDVLVSRDAASLTDYGLAGLLGGKATAEDDVYMFGGVLLEMLTGRSWDGGRLADWALPRIRAAALEVLDVAPADKEEGRLLTRVARVALACVGNDGRSRPRMAEVAAILSDVEAAYGRRDRAMDGEDDDEEGDEGRLSGCLLGPNRGAHKPDMLLRPPM